METLMAIIPDIKANVGGVSQVPIILKLHEWVWLDQYILVV